MPRRRPTGDAPRRHRHGACIDTATCLPRTPTSSGLPESGHGPAGLACCTPQLTARRALAYLARGSGFPAEHSSRPERDWAGSIFEVVGGELGPDQATPKHPGAEPGCPAASLQALKRVNVAQGAADPGRRAAVPDRRRDLGPLEPGMDQVRFMEADAGHWPNDGRTGHRRSPTGRVDKPGTPGDRDAFVPSPRAGRSPLPLLRGRPPRKKGSLLRGPGRLGAEVSRPSERYRDRDGPGEYAGLARRTPVVPGARRPQGLPQVQGTGQGKLAAHPRPPQRRTARSARWDHS